MINNQLRAIFLLVLICSSLSGLAQQEAPNNRFQHKNAGIFELLGSHGLYSINYERVILNEDRFKTLASVGWSFFPVTNFQNVSIDYSSLYWVSANQLFSFGKHHLETGISYGLAPYDQHLWEETADITVDHLLSARIGYRHQAPTSRWLYRVGFTPFLYDAYDWAFYPWAGLSLGYQF